MRIIIKYSSQIAKINKKDQFSYNSYDPYFDALGKFGMTLKYGGEYIMSINI